MILIKIDKMENKQETPEEETLNKIKLVLSCNNDAQAMRLIEQYGQWQAERMYSEEEVLAMLLIKHDGLTPEYVLEQFKNK